MANRQDHDSSFPEKNTAYHCAICSHNSHSPQPQELGRVRGNTARFLNTEFEIWKCPQCGALHSTGAVDYTDIYSNYPLNNRQLDVYARGTLKNLLGRIEQAGLKKSDAILDYGCGNGLFMQFLRERGYQNIAGYDPYIPEFARLPVRAEGYDCVVVNDALEHTHDPRAMLKDCRRLVRPGGMLYAGTADSAGVTDMHHLAPHIMRLHQPFHRVILSQNDLFRLGEELELEQINSWKRSYMDTLRPFANYRFLDEFNAACGHNMDKALDPSAGWLMVTHPVLWFYALLGYFFPSAFEPAVLWRRPLQTTQ